MGGGWGGRRGGEGREIESVSGGHDRYSMSKATEKQISRVNRAKCFVANQKEKLYLHAIQR